MKRTGTRDEEQGGHADNRDAILTSGRRAGVVGYNVEGRRRDDQMVLTVDARLSPRRADTC